MSDGGHGAEEAGRSGSGDDLMSADRRTLVIGVVAMVALVLVGVVSGSLFAGSACDDIAPRTVAAPEGAGDLDLLGRALDGLDDEVLADLRAQLTAATEQLGEVTGVAAAPGATSLAATSGGVASLGEEVVQWRSTGDLATAAVSLGSGTAVGSGPHLYSLALTNPLTGQVDALQPLDEDLAGLTCQDTALVGSPLAFHLAAGDGQLLLLRVEEDGDEPELELRDPVAGQVWAAELQLPTSPAGLAGARLTAGLGPEVVVAGTRTTPGEEAPVFTAVARADGAPLWSVDRAALEDAGVAMAEQRATRAEVVGVGGELALAVLREVEGGGRADEEAEQDLRSVGPQRLVALDPLAGTVRWQLELAPTERVVAARAKEGGGQVVLVDPGSSQSRIVIATLDGARAIDGPAVPPLVEQEHAAPAEPALPAPTTPGSVSLAGVAALPAGGTLAGVGPRLLVLPGAVTDTDLDDVASLELPVPIVDVVGHEGGVSVLLTGPDEQRAVVTFDGRSASG